MACIILKTASQMGPIKIAIISQDQQILFNLNVCIKAGTPCLEVESENVVSQSATLNFDSKICIPVSLWKATQEHLTTIMDKLVTGSIFL